MTISKSDAMKKNEYITILGAPDRIYKKEIINSLSKCSTGRNLSFTLFFNNKTNRWVFMESTQIKYDIERVSTIKYTIKIDLSNFKTNKQLVDYLYEEIKLKILSIKLACINMLKNLRSKGMYFSDKEFSTVYTFIYKKKTKV